MQDMQEDKIDLRELWQVLAKRKKTIIITTLIMTVSALAYVLLVKPVYEVKSVLELAQINKINIHNTHEIKQKFEFIFEVGLKGKKIDLPIITSISIPKKTESMLVVTAQGYDNESASNKLEEMISAVKALQNTESTNYVNLQKKRITLLQNDINITEQSILNIISKISIYESRLFDIEKKDAALAGIYAIELGKMQAEVNTLRKNKSALSTEKNELLFTISSTNITRTKIVGKIEILEKPVKPKKGLIVVVAFITGLMLSIFLTFFLEFIQSARKEEATNS